MNNFFCTGQKNSIGENPSIKKNMFCNYDNDNNKNNNNNSNKFNSYIAQNSLKVYDLMPFTINFKNIKRNCREYDS